MEANSKSGNEYISTNPFASKDNQGRQPSTKEGKRPRIQKPVYSVRLF